MYKCGLYLGRFQPLHIGHISIIDKMLDECDHIIIAVGSAQESGTERNPLSFMFRSCLIEEVYSDYLDDITILPIRDRDAYSDDSSWGTCLFKQVSEMTLLRPTVIYEGDEVVNDHWYDELDIPVVKVSRYRLPISGTDLRKAINSNYKNFALEYLPTPIHKYYDEIRKEIQNAAVNSKCNPVD